MTTTIEKCPCCSTDVVRRFAGSEDEYYEAVVENADQLQGQMYLVKKAIKKYYLALDERKHGGQAEHNAFEEIQKALGMHWEQGMVLSDVENHPRLRNIYA
jgi:hypothetical protein